MEWVLIAFIFTTVLEGTPIEQFSSFERCMAKATSLRLQQAAGQDLRSQDTQFMCWPKQVTDQIKPTGVGRS